MGAGTVQPCSAGGFHFDVSYLLCFGDVCGYVYITIADVAPCKSGEFFGAYPGEEQEGKGCSGINGAAVHEACCFLRRVDGDGFAFDSDTLHAGVGGFLYEFFADCP